MKNDKHYVALTLSGDEDAFRHLVDKYKNSVYGIILSKIQDFHHAEDLTQEAFIQAYLHLDGLRDKSKFGPWVCAIARNLTCKWLRDRHDLVSLEMLMEEKKIDFAEPLSDETSEMQKCIWEAISKLPEISQEVVFLFYMREYPQSQIADLLEISVSAVKNRLYDARKRLKKEILKMLEETVENNPLKSNFSEETVEKARLRATKAFHSRWTAKDGHNETIKRYDEYLEMQEHMSQNERYKANRADVLFGKGMTLLDPLNQVQEAIECFKDGLGLAQETDYLTTEILCCLGLARAYTITKDFDKATEYLRQTHDVSLKHVATQIEEWGDGRLTHSVSNLLKMIDVNAMSPLDVRMILREELRRVMYMVKWMVEIDQKLDRKCMVNVNQLIENTLKLLAPQFEKQGIKVSKSLTPVQKSYGNPITLKQAFFNIIVNAIHAMPDGGELKVSSSIEQFSYKIEISDNGTGIPERFPLDKSLISVRDKIFKVGFSTKEKGGMGMGLPIAKEAIEAYGGQINFTSEEGKGTTFIIELPFPV